MSNNADMYGISKNKAGASWKNYASLFEKHVSPLENGDICFISLGNIDVIFKLLENFKNCKVYIYDNESLCKSIELLAPAYWFDAGQFVFNSSDDILESIKESTMKFDRIVMNPPYSKNLHLKILAEAIKHLKDEDSTCVNLSPVRWLQDPLAKYKKNSDYHRFEESVSKHIDKLEIWTAHDIQQLFSGTIMNMDVGIYRCKSDSIFNVPDIIDPIAKKVAKYTSQTAIEFDANKRDGWRVRLPLITGGRSGGSGDRGYGLMSIGKLLHFKDGKTPDGTKWWYECYMKNQHSKTTPEITLSVKFDSEIEAKNFIATFNTDFFKYTIDKLMSDVNIAPEKIIWLGDAVNPRTGLKGYQGEWTDDDLYTFFNITPDEQKIIEETMAKYK